MRCEETIAFEAYDVAVGAGESCCSFYSLFCVVCLVDLFLCAVTGNIPGAMHQFISAVLAEIGPWEQVVFSNKQKMRTLLTQATGGKNCSLAKTARG